MRILSATVILGLAGVASLALAAGPSTKKQEARAANSAGFEAHKSKDYRKAAKLFRKATELNPNYATAHFNLACALTLLSKGDGCSLEYDAVFRALERAVDLDPRRTKKLFKDPDLASLRVYARLYALAGRPLDHGETVRDLLLERESFFSGWTGASVQLGLMDDESWWYTHKNGMGETPVKKTIGGRWRVRARRLELCLSTDSKCAAPLTVQVKNGGVVLRGVSGQTVAADKTTVFSLREECAN